MQIHLGSEGYPDRLLALPDPPRVLTTTGPLERDPIVAPPVVAIVGSRRPLDESRDFARELATTLARAGAIVVSGGAVGIDGTAHEAALDAGGRTWVVCPTGQKHVFPREHDELFARVAASPDGRLIWPFPDDRCADGTSLKIRNGIIVALADAVVVVQAHLKSGSRNAATWARNLVRPLWVVPGAPWMKDFGGSLAELASGARVLYEAKPLLSELDLDAPSSSEASWLTESGDHESQLNLGYATAPAERKRRRSSTRSSRVSPRATTLQDLELSTAASPAPQRPKSPLHEPPDQTPWNDEEKLMYSVLSTSPTHLEFLAYRAELPVGSAVTALLTLALKNVVVEGPDGFFRRRNAG